MSRALRLVYEEMRQSKGGVRTLADFPPAAAIPPPPAPFPQLERLWPEGSPQRVAADLEYLRSECISLEAQRLDNGVTSEIAKDLFKVIQLQAEREAARVHREVELCNARRKAAQLQHRRVMAEREEALAELEARLEERRR